VRVLGIVILVAVVELNALPPIVVTPSGIGADDTPSATAKNLVPSFVRIILSSDLMFGLSAETVILVTVSALLLNILAFTLVDVNPEPMETEVLWWPAKAPPPIEVTLSGILMPFVMGQGNALPPMEMTPSSSTRFAKLLQAKKAEEPMLVQVPGILTDVRLLQ
jgi:hypothetical protein